MRRRVREGLNRFRDAFGADPKVHANHVGQREAVYWGPDRFDAPMGWLYGAYRRSRRPEHYEGAKTGSPWFWGDLCRSRIRYVRNMVFREVNTLKADPLMPYRDPSRPLVEHWFSASYGATPDDFCEFLSEANQDRLVEEQGACIVYTHFGGRFTPMSRRFEDLIRRVSSLPGWFVPVSTLLDYVGA